MIPSFYSYLSKIFGSFLTFSDSAKFYEASRNLLSGSGFVINHSFFDHSLLSNYQPGQSWPVNFLPLVSVFMSYIFKVFPANDTTVAIVGYSLFLVSLVLTFLIAKKLHSTLAGIAASTIFASSLFFFDYAKNASTEVFFTAEILLFVFLVLQKKKASWLAIFPLILMFLTRQQAILFLLSLPIYFFFFHLKSWRTRLLTILPILIISSCLYLVARKDVSSIYSPLKPFYSAQTSAGVSQGLYLRGLNYDTKAINLKSILSKVFYNLYNFSKDPERLLPSSVFLFFFFSFFHPKNLRFSLFTGTVFTIFILGASASIPNARYVHPVIPLVIIAASATLVDMVIKFSPRHLYLILSVSLFFILVPTLGNFTLDRRFRQNQFNLDKPPVYKEISRVMAESLPRGQLIVTNLDAWAAWYGGLTTMWFPISPNYLKGFQDKAKYIVITNYLENDGDFTLGEWKEVVYSPDRISNKFLKDNYKILKTFSLTPDRTYENREYRGTILVQK